MSAIKENKTGLKVLIAGSVLQLFLGIIYVWSVFVMPVSEFYGWDASAVKLTSSYMLCFFVVGILCGGKLQSRLGTDKVALLGGILLAAGMLSTSYIPLSAPWLIYVTYGIIGGFGVGAGYNAIITAAQKQFPKNRGFATGVSVCAFGFSTVIFAPLIEAMVGWVGLPNTFRILAAALIITVPALYRMIVTPAEGGTNAPAAILQKKQYSTSEILKTREFYCITLSLMLATAAFFILNPSFKTLAVERGLAPAIGTVVVMITGVANALGRLGAPLISDKIGREKAAISIIVVTMLGTLLLCFIEGAAFIVVIACVAFCYGGYSGIYPVITADYFGIKNVGTNYGAVMVGFALSALAFPMIFSGIQNPTVKYVILAAFAATGALLMFYLVIFKKKGEPNVK